MQQYYISFDELRVQRRVPDATTVRVIRVNEPERQWDQYTDGEMKDCCFRQIMTNTDVLKELNTKKLLRSFPTIQNILAIHPSVDAIKISGFYYAVFFNKDVKPISLRNETDETIEKTLKSYISALKMFHDNDLIHGFVNDTMLNGTIMKSHVHPLLKYNMHCKTYAAFKADKQYSESPYVAPLQIILEMMSSSIEPALMEYKGFKEKFIKFWTHLGYRSCAKNLPKISQELFGESYGAIDFTDYLLQRYCLLNNGYIVKDSSKAFGYLKDIDLFGLAITFHSLLGSNIPLKIKKILGDCVAGNWIDNSDCVTFENVKILSIPEKPIISIPEPIVRHDVVSHKSTPPLILSEEACPIKLQVEENKPKSIQLGQVVSAEAIETSKVVIEPPRLNPIQEQLVPNSKEIKESPLPKQTVETPKTCKFKNEPTLIGELIGSGIKKVKVGGVERIVRMEVDGEYIVWKGSKLYLA